MLRPTASLSWCQTRIWGPRPDFYYSQTAADLLIWGTLSDERTGVSFKIAAGPRQRSHTACELGSWPNIYYSLTVTVLFFWGALCDERMGPSFIYATGPRQRSLSRVWVPWDSWAYFTVSDLRLPFSSPPTTRRVTVQIFEPASTLVFTDWLVLFITSRHGQRRKHRSSVVVQLLPWNWYVRVGWLSRYIAPAVVRSLISLSLPSNGSTCHNVLAMWDLIEADGFHVETRVENKVS
jgi:hypothetical protein